MAIYEKTNSSNTLDIAQYQLYGSSRLGHLEARSSSRNYEFSDHLGNVHLVLDDRREVQSATEYYPFGMPMQTYSPTDYRYGFNGKELDKEGLGGGSSTLDYGFRIYNPALGKFLSVDPLAPDYPWNSSYAYAEGDVIRSVDLDGLEKKIVTHWADGGSTEFVYGKHDGYSDRINFIKNNPNYKNINFSGKSEFGKNSTGTLTVKMDDKGLINSVNWVGKETISPKKPVEKISDEEKPFDMRDFLRDDLGVSGDDTWEGQANGDFGVNNKGAKLLAGTTAIVTAPLAIIGAVETTIGAELYMGFNGKLIFGTQAGIEMAGALNGLDDLCSAFKEDGKSFLNESVKDVIDITSLASDLGSIARNSWYDIHKLGKEISESIDPTDLPSPITKVYQFVTGEKE